MKFNYSVALVLFCVSISSSAADWFYMSKADKMTSQKTESALINSENQLHMNSPYNKKFNFGRLVVRQHPTEGLNVMVSIQEGQMLCQASGDCALSIRFDDDQPIRYIGTKPSDNSSTTIFINDETLFVARIKKAKRILIQFNAYENGSPVLEFSTPISLVWPPNKKQLTDIK